ncbi:hypothetical protein KIL84_004542, partial [Mauremys mutica]
TQARTRCAISTRRCRSPARGCPSSPWSGTWTISSSSISTARGRWPSPAPPGSRPRGPSTGTGRPGSPRAGRRPSTATSALPWSATTRARVRGQHTFQYMYGCQRRADGGAGGFRQYGYDGRDFLSYDTRTHTWVAPSKEAEVTKGKMEADRHLSQQQRDYLERKCVEWLQKYLDYGKETLQRSERPAVQVTSRDTPGGPTTLCCRAHGFYPRDIALRWLRHGGSSEQETVRGGVLPNGDGTYHTWGTPGPGCDRGASLDPSPGREPPSRSALLPALIGAVAVAVAALLAGAAGFVLWRRRRSGKTGAGYTPAQEGNRDSSSSPEGSAATSVGETSFHPEPQQLLAVGVPAPPDDGDPPAGMV